MKFTQLRKSKWFETAYKVGIAIKGIDGLVEFLAGILLLVPNLLHRLLTSVANRASQHNGYFYEFIAHYIARLDSDLSKSGLSFLIVFLIGHGLVKLILVYCLLKRIVAAYPYALAVLVLFLVYQIYALIRDPLSIGMWLFTILDVIIIWLVYGEWKDLKEKVVPSNEHATTGKKQQKTV